MLCREMIQNYLNNFRRHISQYLKPNIGIGAIVYPCKDDGAIIKFDFGQHRSSCDEYKKQNKKITAVLKSNNLLHFFHKDIPDNKLDEVIFKGTNYIIDNKNIILIKDNSPDQWDDKKSEQDVKKVVSKVYT